MNRETELAANKKMEGDFVPTKFGVSPPKGRVLINSVTRNGVHLIASVLEITGMVHGSYGLLNRKKVSLNFRTSNHLSNYFVSRAKQKAPISVGSPRMVRLKIIKKLCAKIKDSEYLISHIPFSHTMEILLNDLKWKNIIIVRDPRDMCASVLHKLREKKNNPARDYLYEKLETDTDRIKALFDGYDGLYNTRGMLDLETMYKSVMHWKGKGNFIFIKFEDLIGPKGGGTLERQNAALVKILKHLDYSDYDNEEVIHWIGDHCFGRTNSFWKGQVGNWKNIFDKEIFDIFIKHNDFIVSLGYEPTI